MAGWEWVCWMSAGSPSPIFFERAAEHLVGGSKRRLRLREGVVSSDAATAWLPWGLSGSEFSHHGRAKFSSHCTCSASSGLRRCFSCSGTVRQRRLQLILRSSWMLLPFRGCAALTIRLASSALRSSACVGAIPAACPRSGARWTLVPPAATPRAPLPSSPPLSPSASFPPPGAPDRRAAGGGPGAASDGVASRASPAS